MNLSQKYVITINREAGSGGRTIGRKLAERLDVNFYDKALIHSLEEKFHLSETEIERLKEKKTSWWKELTDFYTRRYEVSQYGDEEKVATTETLYRAETEILKALVSESSGVIMGRMGFHIFRQEPNKVRVMIINAKENRIRRFVTKQNLTEAQAEADLNRIDEARETYTRRFAGVSRYDARNYDLVLNVAGMTEDDAVEIILKYIKSTEK
ncbi:MAG: cytidylate kinase-like family protein [Paludibacteraceae bacterium]|nr:cytidylate kinase-like family protein [Paludibacteraceae bacterium]